MGTNDKRNSLTRKTIFVTGGSGSFGRAFVKEALSYYPNVIRVLDNNEFGLVDMQNEIRKHANIRYIHGDIRDRERLRAIMNDVDIVIHCAALKHVSVCEYNPTEAIKTNIVGSMNILEIALEKKVDKLVNISSDKSVHPINTYGATKLVVERMFAEAKAYTQTKICSIRFCNFWESRGNVVQLWAKQRAEGNPITLTDKDMSRFFINMDEAVDFAMNCLDTMQGGEIFIPLMPLHFTLSELANTLAPDAKIQYVGKRKGEKKHEELYTEDEERYLTRTEHAIVIRT